MLKTTCTAEQYLAAVRDYDPIYYTRYMIDKNNKPQQVQDATIDRIHEFFAKDYAGRREESEVFAVNYPPEALTSQWPNWGKIFFNNKGVVAKGTENCSKYPSDMSVWDGPSKHTSAQKKPRGDHTAGLFLIPTNLSLPIIGFP